MLHQVTVSEGKKKFRTDLLAIRTLEGLIILATGGEKPHVGAVAIAIPRPSLKDSGQTSVTLSSFTLVGHKDHVIANEIAETIAKEFNEVTVAIAGMHIENAEEKDIRQLVANSKKALENLIHELHKTKCVFSKKRIKTTRACRRRSARERSSVHHVRDARTHAS